MTSPARGLMYGTLAYLCWGLFPLYWPLLEPASPLEILACRILFSLVSVALLLAARHQLNAARRMSRRTLLRLCVAAAVIAVNWGGYIWGVNNQHVVETSLGYFINPLITIALGVILLHERLRLVQWLAVLMGVVAVAALSIPGGRVPWLALLLACSFGTYGLIKKNVGVSPPQGLLVEAAALTIPALAVVTALAASGGATWIGPRATGGHLLLLAGAGPVTMIPLLFFAGAANRLSLSSLGLLQYLNPVMQLAIGVFVRHEPMPPVRLAGFALVWSALVLLTVDALHHHRRGPTTVADPELASAAMASSPVPVGSNPPPVASLRRPRRR